MTLCLVVVGFSYFADIKIRTLLLRLLIRVKPQNRFLGERLGLPERLPCYLEFNTKIQLRLLSQNKKLFFSEACLCCVVYVCVQTSIYTLIGIGNKQLLTLTGSQIIFIYNIYKLGKNLSNNSLYTCLMPVYWGLQRTCYGYCN